MRKKLTLVEVTITVLLLVMVASGLRFITVDLINYSNNITHNLSNVNTIRSVMALTDMDIKMSHDIVVEENLLILKNHDFDIRYEIKENALYRNGVKKIPLNSIKLTFSDGTLPGENNRKLVKLNFTYSEKTSKTENTYEISKLIGVMGEGGL